MNTKDRLAKSGTVIGLKIESHRPEDSPKFIALKLADTIQEESNARSDALEYKSQAQRERQKAKELTNLLTMLNEYNRKKKKAINNGEDWKPSRMEPMESYDEEDIRAQRVELIERAKEFDKLSNNFNKIAKEASQEQARLQKKLRGLTE